jgi:DNA-directed RNA polymerase specialized sigma24 family protein
MTAAGRKRERLWLAIAARSRPARLDFDLLDRWRAGERAAGEELCRRYFDGLCGFFATKCGADAGELAQRTMLASVRARDPGERSSFRAYLFMLARDELYRHLQRRRAARLDFSITSIAEIMAHEERDGGS